MKKITLKPQAERPVMTVSDLTKQIKETLEAGFPSVFVQGELSNAHLHSSGHFYFTLKDESSQICGVMWRSRAGSLAFRPEDGMKVLVSGRLCVYEARGQYQIDAWSIRPAGVGELQAAFERLKKRLEAEGLFDPSRKRDLPRVPRRIGIVTSSTGAALQDMLNIIGRRFPCVEVVVRHAKVQGLGAAEEIAGGVDDLNELGNVDVIIVGRGGGSAEDLWAFNEEVVARAIARSCSPVVSAVGHEIDVTIADYVADLRAPTPSAAAELVVPDRLAILDELGKTWYTVSGCLHDTLDDCRTRVANLLSGYGFARPADLLHQHSQRVDDLQRSIGMLVSHNLTLTEARQTAVYQRLQALNPRLPLQRGYALVKKDGSVVSSSRSLTRGDQVDIEFRDGSRPATID